MLHLIVAFVLGMICGAGGLFILALNYNSHEAGRDRAEKDNQNNV